MSEQQRLTDEGPIGKYFHFMLNMADDDLDLYEYRLLGHYRRVCGAYNHPCRESTAETARKIEGLSQGKVSETRRVLADRGWITLIEAKNNALHVVLVDRMAENIQRYLKPSGPEAPPDKPSGHESLSDKPSGPENSLQEVKTKPSPGEGKNQPIKNQHQNQPENHESTPSPNTDSSSESKSAPSHDAPSGDDGDEIWALIEPEIRKLHLNPARKEALKNRGPVQALAIAWAAQKGHTPGGLAVSLMDTGGPPDDQLERAEAAVKLKTLNPRTLDSHINHRDLATLSETVTGRAHREQDSTSRLQPEQQQKPPALLGAIPPGVYDEFTRILKTMLAHPPGEWVFDVMPQRYETGAQVLHVVSSGPTKEIEMAFHREGLTVQAVQVVSETAQEAVKV